MPFIPNTPYVPYPDFDMTDVPAIHNDILGSLFDTTIEELDSEIIHDPDMNNNETINDMFDNNGNPIENYDMSYTMTTSNSDDFVHHIDNNVHVVPEEPINIISDGTILNNLQPINLLYHFNEVGPISNQIDDNNNSIHPVATSNTNSENIVVDDDDDVNEWIQSMPITPPRLTRQHAFHPDLTPRRDDWSDSDDEEINERWNQHVNIVTPSSLINYTDINDDHMQNI
jgi:hypothetical protein